IHNADARFLDRDIESSKIVHAALLLLMLEAADADLVKRSTLIFRHPRAGRPITPSQGQIPSLQRCPRHDRSSAKSGSPSAVLLCRGSAKNGVTRRSKSALVSAAILGLWSAAGTPGQAHRKYRAFARFARHRYVAAHHARELARQRKAEPRAAEFLRG